MATELEGNHMMRPDMPIIDIIFAQDEDGDTSVDTLEARRIICSFPKIDILINQQYEEVSGIYIPKSDPTGYINRGMTKLNRKINKNPIYINFPVDSETSGGYAYDLGFTEDTFSISMVSADWSEYERLCALVKCNVGEKPARIHVGKVPSDTWSTFEDDNTYTGTTIEDWDTNGKYEDYGCHTYECIIRNSDATLEPGTQMISYNIECTVVYNE